MVVCAANLFPGNVLVLGARHFDTAMRNQIQRIFVSDIPKCEQGFIDQHGIFMDRKEALEVAKAAGQLNTRRTKTNPDYLLFSEDLY